MPKDEPTLLDDSTRLAGGAGHGSAPEAPGQCDLAVVGGGILGLAVARELKSRHPELETVVLEAADRVGTGRPAATAA